MTNDGEGSCWKLKKILFQISSSFSSLSSRSSVICAILQRRVV